MENIVSRGGPHDGVVDLKQVQRDLFGEMERLKNGMVLRLEFRHGLPCLIETSTDVMPDDTPVTVTSSPG